MSVHDRDTIGLTFYRQLTRLSGPLTDFLLRRRLVQGKEDPARVSERRGHPSRPRPEGPLVWIHCASVGESLSALPLIERLSKARNDLNFLVTSGTVTSAQLMEDRLPAKAIHQYVPLDHPSYCARFLAHWQPDLGVMIESELWPNLILGAHERGVKLVLANARLSASSFKGWRKARKSIARLLSAFDLVLAQEEKSAARLNMLQAPQVSVPGNLKDDAPALPCDKTSFETLLMELKDRPRWVAASTHESEELLAGRVHIELKRKVPDLLTMIVPRHPARGDGIAKGLHALGLSVAQRSKRQIVSNDTDVYLADTLGEMGLLYRLADIAFIGGSFVDVGGHNPLEAARLDCALLFGPHMYNFEISSNALLEAGAALEVESATQLAIAVADLLSDKSERDSLAAKSKEVAAISTGVASRMCDMLLPLLPPPGSDAEPPQGEA